MKEPRGRALSGTSHIRDPTSHITRLDRRPFVSFTCSPPGVLPGVVYRYRFSKAGKGAVSMAIRVKSRGGESVEGLMRRFKKLCEKEGLTKDIKRKEFYEKPSERRRRAMRKSQVRRIKTELGPLAKGAKPEKPDKRERA